MKSPTVGAPLTSTERASGTYQKLKQRREAGEINGFTLIEILIVIVVLGILAAVVIFALGGITGQSAEAACEADGATVSTALAAFNNQNPNATATEPDLLNGTSANGMNPYIQSWPSNDPHYAFSLDTNGVLDLTVPTGGSTNPYTGVSSCSSVS
jgi:prepilin-type N-terminal cleavage/methylation domain-containing protein